MYDPILANKYGQMRQREILNEAELIRKAQLVRPLNAVNNTHRQPQPLRRALQLLTALMR